MFTKLTQAVKQRLLRGRKMVMEHLFFNNQSAKCSCPMRTVCRSKLLANKSTRKCKSIMLLLILAKPEVALGSVTLN